MVRELRSLSQENVAMRLGVAQNTYSGYENNQIKISAEMLQKIAEVLEVSPIDLMNQQPAIINFQTNQGTLFGNIETVIMSQKELYEQMLSSKEAEIERMQKIIDGLLGRK